MKRGSQELTLGSQQHLILIFLTQDPCCQAEQTLRLPWDVRGSMVPNTLWLQVHLLPLAEVSTGPKAHSKCFTDVSPSPVSRRQEACEEPTASENMAAWT